MPLQMLFDTVPTPKRTATPQSFPTRGERRTTATDASNRMRTILIVDDESDIAESFQDLLERSVPNLRALTATSGLEALNILAREGVDLILTDYRMPGMDGFELLRRAQGVAPEVRRMVVSAYPLEVNAWVSQRHRLDRVIPKPVDAQDLVDAVQESLDRQI
jgi:CheY-like chemotaxis protein